MPDWDNPMPHDGYPDEHDTAFFAVLNCAIRELQAWVTAAYVQKAPRGRATDLAASLVETARRVTEYTETLDP
ncbi:hypothetical protein JOF56_002979 [Kibdelosporangium banguiense]|uniref:Uncharacterized protein n=1 Tax=Kibdelosporangium banguiense TaxID=1365924 RepID=A0ABS4TE20_9PSEU|nr:hypothetical protein [Kibdelosporangium banguiense]MBP2322594.1 hypothetical protein [Kibdelosporangium banguiense]